MFYVYEWFDKDNGEVFYVGKGCHNRYRVKKHNNLFNYFIKTKNCDSRIIKTFDLEVEAFEYEAFRIAELKEIGQCVCNIREGGFGGVTSWWDEERRKHYSIHNVMKSQSQRLRMTNNNPMKNPCTAEKVAAKARRPIIYGDKEYSSAKDLAKEFSLSTNAVAEWANRGFSPKEICCYYKDKGKRKGWEEAYKKRHSQCTKKVIVDTVVFDSLKSAADFLGISIALLCYHLAHSHKYKNHICNYANQQPSHGNNDKSTVEGSTTNG